MNIIIKKWIKNVFLMKWVKGNEWNGPVGRLTDECVLVRHLWAVYGKMKECLHYYRYGVPINPFLLQHGQHVDRGVDGVDRRELVSRQLNSVFTIYELFSANQLFN